MEGGRSVDEYNRLGERYTFKRMRIEKGRAERTFQSDASLLATIRLGVTKYKADVVGNPAGRVTVTRRRRNLQPIVTLSYDPIIPGERLTKASAADIATIAQRGGTFRNNHVFAGFDGEPLPTLAVGRYVGDGLITFEPVEKGPVYVTLAGHIALAAHHHRLNDERTGCLCGWKFKGHSNMDLRFHVECHRDEEIGAVLVHLATN
jgi:hypothetical protein